MSDFWYPVDPNKGFEMKMDYNIGRMDNLITVSRDGMQKEQEKNSDNLFTLWSSADDTEYYPVAKTCKTLPPDIYEFVVDRGDYRFVRIKYSVEDLIVFDGFIDEIVNDIESFWNKKELFNEYGLSFRRGILLYGGAGCGKSCTVKLIVHNVLKRGGIAVKLINPITFIQCMRIFRGLQPETPVVVIMEDLDALMNGYQSQILNLLDGIDSFDKVVYLATTNYPEVLEPRIKNRPSRFDKRYEIKTPNEGARERYLKHLISKSDKINKNIDLEKWVSDTRRMSFAHIKELFISVCLFDKDYEESIDSLKNMAKKISSDSFENDRGGVGFRK